MLDIAEKAFVEIMMISSWKSMQTMISSRASNENVMLTSE
jgi:hypothetical protein